MGGAAIRLRDGPPFREHIHPQCTGCIYFLLICPLFAFQGIFYLKVIFFSLKYNLHLSKHTDHKYTVQDDMANVYNCVTHTYINSHPDSCSAHGWLMRWLKIIQPWTLPLLLRGGGRPQQMSLGSPRSQLCKHDPIFKAGNFHERWLPGVQGPMLDLFLLKSSHKMGMFQ